MFRRAYRAMRRARPLRKCERTYLERIAADVIRNGVAERDGSSLLGFLHNEDYILRQALLSGSDSRYSSKRYRVWITQRGVEAVSPETAALLRLSGNTVRLW